MITMVDITITDDNHGWSHHTQWEPWLIQPKLMRTMFDLTITDDNHGWYHHNRWEPWLISPYISNGALGCLCSIIPWCKNSLKTLWDGALLFNGNTPVICTRNDSMDDMDIICPCHPLSMIYSVQLLLWDVYFM